MKLNEVNARLEEIGIQGAVVDATNPSIRIVFKSTREDLASRSFKLIGDITSLINAKRAGQDYTQKTNYFPRYQPFIDADTSEFGVEQTTKYKVQK
jgi:hypothetical protein